MWTNLKLYSIINKPKHVIRIRVIIKDCYTNIATLKLILYNTAKSRFFTTNF